MKHVQYNPNVLNDVPSLVAFAHAFMHGQPTQHVFHVCALARVVARRLWDVPLAVRASYFAHDHRNSIHTDDEEALYAYCVSVPHNMSSLVKYAQRNNQAGFFVAAQAAELGYINRDIATVEVFVHAMQMNTSPVEGCDKTWELTFAESLRYFLIHDRWPLELIAQELGHLDPPLRNRAALEVLQATTGISLGVYYA